MGVSETIVAAMIGAVATVTTALFQLFGAIRARGNADAKPKRGLTLRSVLAVLVLMVTSAAGGFLYSELLRHSREAEIHAMRQTLKELKGQIAANTSAARQARSEAPAQRVQPTRLEAQENSAESVAYVPACRAQIIGATCEEADAQRIALCGTIPSYAQVRAIDLFVQPDAVQDPWEDHRVLFEQDIGGAKFTGKSFEYAQGSEHKAVCVNFVHWSSGHPHIARLLVHYGFRNVPSVTLPDMSFDALEADTAPRATPAVIAWPSSE